MCRFCRRPAFERVINDEKVKGFDGFSHFRVEVFGDPVSGM